MPLTSNTFFEPKRFVPGAEMVWMGPPQPSRTRDVVAKQKWEILSSEYVVESPWYRLRRDACRLPDGTVVESYYVREHAGFSVTFAITPHNEVVFTRQYKHGFGDFVLELPGGMLEPDEDALACARRELEEETGYVAAQFEPVAEFITDPTSSTGRFSLFIARDAVPEGSADPENTEAIDTVLVPMQKVLDQVRNRHVRAQSQVASIYTALDHLGRLKLG